MPKSGNFSPAFLGSLTPAATIDEENNISYGLPCYTFQNFCKENAEVNLNDKSLTVIYNASAYEFT